MWIAAIIAALGVGVRVFGAVLPNQTLKKEGRQAVGDATAINAIDVLKADAAYLGAIAQNNTDNEAAQAEKARLEAVQKRLNTLAIVASVILAIVAIVIAVEKSKQ